MYGYWKRISIWTFSVYIKPCRCLHWPFFQDAGEAESSKRRAEELQSPAAAGGPVAAKRLRPDDDEPEIMPAPGGPATTASDMQQ